MCVPILALKRLSTRLTILNANKARNLMITRKRIPLSEPELISAINGCDVVMVKPESSEQLLKHIASKEEVKCYLHTMQLLI